MSPTDPPGAKRESENNYDPTNDDDDQGEDADTDLATIYHAFPLARLFLTTPRSRSSSQAPSITRVNRVHKILKTVSKMAPRVIRCFCRAVLLHFRRYCCDGGVLAIACRAS